PDTTGHDTLLPTSRTGGGHVAPPNLPQHRSGIAGNSRERGKLDALLPGLPTPAAPHPPHTQPEEHDHQQGQQQAVHYTIFPSRAVTHPRSNVARTTPGSRIPS